MHRPLSIIRTLTALLTVLTLFASCREDEIVVPTQYDIVPSLTDDGGGYAGLYVLNEGNMGSNKCTLDYLDYRNGYYVRNLYAERNPSQIKELGDVGNDIQVYGSRIYVVVNCSNKVEVLDAHTGKRIGQWKYPTAATYVSTAATPTSRRM